MKEVRKIVEEKSEESGRENKVEVRKGIIIIRKRNDGGDKIEMMKWKNIDERIEKRLRSEERKKKKILIVKDKERREEKKRSMSVGKEKEGKKILLIGGNEGKEIEEEEMRKIGSER